MENCRDCKYGARACGRHFANWRNILSPRGFEATMGSHQLTLLGCSDHNSWMLPVILPLESNRDVGHVMGGSTAVDVLRDRNKLRIGRLLTVLKFDQG
jgi:hypothetical protein